MKKTAALYDPFLDTLGGGEKHILSILQVLEEEGYELHVFWNTDLNREIIGRFNLVFKCPIVFHPSPFTRGTGQYEKLKNLSIFDLFFYVTDGSYFFSSAKRNFIFAMVPDPSLYRMSIINRLKVRNYSFIANSRFTASKLKMCGINSEVIYPYIADSLLDNSPAVKKQKTILSVGRFFGHLHAKKHSEMIHAFYKLQKAPEFSDYSLILAGGLSESDTDYFRTIADLAKMNPRVILKPNIAHEELQRLYRGASYFWHFTGYGVDPEIHPESVEHLGMAPLEAMANQCITFCYDAGGPKELIDDGKNGFLFAGADELMQKMKMVEHDTNRKKKIRENAKIYVQNNFDYDVFRTRVKNIILVNP